MFYELLCALIFRDAKIRRHLGAKAKKAAAKAMTKGKLGEAISSQTGMKKAQILKA